MFVCCECCVLSRRGLCDELITRPEKSYRLWCVVVCDLETSRMRRPWPALGRSVMGGKNSSVVTLITPRTGSRVHSGKTSGMVKMYCLSSQDKHHIWNTPNRLPERYRQFSTLRKEKGAGNKALSDIHITRIWTFTEFDSHRRSIGIQEREQEHLTPPFHTYFHCGYWDYGDQQKNSDNTLVLTLKLN